MKDFENSASSGALLFEFVLGLPYLYRLTLAFLKKSHASLDRNTPHKKAIKICVSPFFSLEEVISFSFV
jgi:hypothetical protein